MGGREGPNTTINGNNCMCQHFASLTYDRNKTGKSNVLSIYQRISSEKADNFPK